ncbi:MAG: hypothetical protein ABI847_14110, partial [Anaerolineales bacterium]
VALAAPPPALAALAVTPNYQNDGLVFTGTLADGVHYSADRGAHWKSDSLGLIDMNVLCLAVAPNFKDEALVLAGTQSGLFCSRNGGRSWREVELPVGYEAVLCLALSPEFGKDRTVFAGTETQGLLVSEDAGVRWRRMGEAVLSSSISQIALAPEFPSRPQLLVLHDGSLAASDDGGATWRPWAGRPPQAEGATAFLAPRGWAAGEPVLLGLESGGIARVEAE